MVTKTLYKSIKALNENLYMFNYDDYFENNVLLDNKCNIVE